ncbi:Alpha-monoglucosyldiacylglycerol synthase [Defluviimonas aquaemixtae]|uniref:Alpha-monoglucosyldiacylglycerol synthase n=1 Tax=Albidovulum aquaemixtae TaxID=1542388 RepID=A0A2R8B6E6_9RHOB|nr:glycosyltransferase family 4 protein [Defluviimonas aquaemixtae]SPH18231.1 Alpha-monoglucosyldiacylglycerol synthase [Defluviimonas aquaemixtae]
MRIFEVGTEFGVGGIARHIIDLTHWLRDAGHTVYFAGGADALLDSSKDDYFFTVPLAKVSASGGSVATRLFNMMRCVAILRRYLKRYPADVIHCHESAPALVAKLAATGMGIPIAVTYHGSEPERVRSFGRIGRFAADIVITPSHRCADELHDLGGVPRERLRVVGLGVKPAPDVDQNEVARLRADLLGEDGKLLVLLLARASYQKGLDILIEVASEILKIRTDIRFVVAGIGPMFEALKALAREKRVDSHVNFIGETHRPYHYLHAADIFLLTSRWEALPISIVEAFRAGVPVIATDAGGVRQLVDENVGAVVPIGDVEECVRQLLHLANDEGLRANMSKAALARSREDRFTPDVIHAQFERLYGEMTHRRGHM